MLLTEKKICSGIWSFLFFLIAIEPYAFTVFEITDLIYEIAIFGMFSLLLTLRIGNSRKDASRDCERPHSRIPYLVLLYYMYLLLVTIFNRGLVKGVLMRGIQFTNFALYIDIVLKNNPKALFKTGLNILTFYIFLNCICFFIYPNGLYSDALFDNNYLLGYDNQNINFILPALILVLIKHQYYKKCKLQIIFTYVIALVTIIKAWSGMSLVIVICTSAFAFFFYRRKTGFVATKILDGRVFNLFNLFIINVISFIALVFMHVESFFEYIITGVLGKSLTLTGRTTIWAKNLAFIKENPVFGYGQEEVTHRAVKLGYKGLSAGGLHAHNRFLEVMYSGGLILLSIYLYMIFYTIRCLKSVRNTFFGKILAFGIFIYLMGMLTEQYPYCPFFWGFMVMAENATDCIQKSPSGGDK